MPAVSAPADICRIAWSYVVAVLEELDERPEGHGALPAGKAELLAGQLRQPRDLLALTDSLICLAVRLWSDAHNGDVHAAREHAALLALEMAGRG